MKILFLDTETTGLSAYKNSIIQLSCIAKVDGAEDFDNTFDEYARPWPEDEYDPESLVINGVTPEFLEGQQSQRMLHRKFKSFLEKYVDPYDKGDKFHLVAYNAGFDDDFLRNFFKKNEDSYYGSWFWFPYIDVMTLTAFFFREERTMFPNFKLKTVADRLNIEVSGDEAFHNSLYDVRVTMELYKLLKD